MRPLLVKVRDTDAMIVGYGPGDKGTPKAIVVMAGRLWAVPLEEVQLLNVPKRLRKAERLTEGVKP